MSIIIPKGTEIPAKKTKTYYTVSDYQTKMGLDIYEGEDNLIKNNKNLGKFSISGLYKALKSVVSVEVTLEIDNSNMLSVTAIDKYTGNTVSVQIKRDIDELDVE
jgi:molecular chaperone DnaK (HSP70)